MGKFIFRKSYHIRYYVLIILSIYIIIYNIIYHIIWDIIYLYMILIFFIFNRRKYYIRNFLSTSGFACFIDQRDQIIYFYKMFNCPYVCVQSSCHWKFYKIMHGIKKKLCVRVWLWQVDLLWIWKKKSTKGGAVKACFFFHFYYYTIKRWIKF